MNMNKSNTLFALLVLFFSSHHAFASDADRIAPIEERPNIFDTSKQGMDKLDAAVAIAKNEGFICDSVGGFRPMITEGGYLLSCNKYKYQYKIQEFKGRWTATLDSYNY